MTTDEILKQIGVNIRKIRNEKNTLQQDLAALCNFEVSVMSRIEAGGSNFTIGTLNKIAQALEVDIKDLLP
ncbi:MAG: helix-turn-helix domain-containing protein [Alistipes sp.]|nr:helix-turn-helix domain-containing protein [Alistipes sp.]